MADAAFHSLPSSPTNQRLAEIKSLCTEIATVKTEDTQALFGDLHKMATLYYEGALRQATQSFRTAQVAAGVGTLFFLAAVAVLAMHQDQRLAWISGAGGAIVHLISGLNFHLYAKATRQFEVFHACLERMGRYLMANSVCANIENGEKRDEARLELVRTMAAATMLPIEELDDHRKSSSSSRTTKPRMASKSATA